ncbi:putative thiamine transport system ATP-binding protein [Breoghania corrubedonensis]|uniref:Putative thiamine transport system ATP-binding protein n=1 Tax=Breoghania corrubedonensis TaxID=665038 RepID=A0A2T5VFJ1_9HYPH|nr:ATP-binding cassette domain-containing protein [Breoghania corrubedonensis]PTW62522.1 putative thiamine transport system ATP-binding protein [Breoghania corrubedonensis]
MNKQESAADLVLEDVRILRAGQPLIHIAARVEPGSVLTVMGESGIGKSTLLSYLAGFLPPDFSGSGRVLLGGTDITALPAHARRMGLLFQDDLLFAHMSVIENLMFAVPHDVSRAERRRRAEAALCDVALENMETRDPATLSGGQRARVALMRVLLSEPRALLLDEPFSRLDMALRDQIRALVFAKARERHLATLLVTHDVRDAEAAKGPVITLQGRQDTAK